MEEINFEDFLRVQIRTGTILEATLNTKARNPAYILRIDFGPLGIKTSSAQITENYQLDELVGLQISAVLNFLPNVLPDLNLRRLCLELILKKKKWCC